MSRRRAWFGRTGGRGRVEYVVVDAPAPPHPDAVLTGILTTDDAELSALVERTRAENRELAAENENLKASRQRLQAALDAAVADISKARAETADARQHSGSLEERLTALTASLADAENHTAGQCRHAAQARAQRVLMAALQDRLDLLQAANEAHDVFTAGRP